MYSSFTPVPLTEDLAELLRAARDVQARAHVPYSRFRVGAALRTSAGTVYAGCNVENAAYPQGWCAEASAIAAMVSAGETTIATMMVICDGEMLGTPCGGCRQKIREFASPTIMIHVAGAVDSEPALTTEAGLLGIRASYSMDQLLPDSFGPEHLS
jgi:cytidine deaminase